MEDTGTVNLSMHDPALLRGILAGALLLSGASACSRHDRAGAGRDATESAATAVTPSDSQISTTAPQPSSSAATQPSSGYREMERDSSAQAPSDSSVRATAPDTTSPEMAGTGAATLLDSAGVTSDYALTTDTATAGYSEMARDTSSAVADTTTAVESDTAGIKVQMDTVNTDTLAVATADSADTATAKGEQAAGQVANADTLQANSGRIRPPEDSTEIAGNVTSDHDRAKPTPREVPTEAAGAAPTGNAVTGIDAVSLMSRAGARCVVKDDSSEVWWDLADSPAALNPCGTGTMTLSLVKTEAKH